MTQTWLTDEYVGGDRPTYEPVSCLACSQQHFICIATGRALGDSAQGVTSTRSPTFPPKQIDSRQKLAASGQPGIGSRSGGDTRVADHAETH